MAQYSAAEHRASSTLREHEAIVAALEAGDAETARAAISAHLRNAKSEILSKLRAGARLSN
jgi:DNA-binding GntR family transcriptional regulator